MDRRKNYNQRQRNPALKSGYSKSMTNINKNLLGKPPRNRASQLRLSPIVGSSPEPGSDNMSSPSRIPRSKSQPPSRLVSPNHSRNPSRSTSRNVSRNPSRNPSRDPSPTSPSRIPKKRQIDNFKTRQDRISSAKPKVLPKNRINRTGTRKNLGKLEEQSSQEFVDEDENWNTDYSQVHSRQISRAPSKTNLDKNGNRSVTNSTTHSTKHNSVENSAKHSVESSTRRKNRLNSSIEESKDDDILSITIDASGMSSTTEIVSQSAATMAQPVHVEAKLIRSRDSLNSLVSNQSGSDTPSSNKSSRKVSEASTVYERQQSGDQQSVHSTQSSASVRGKNSAGATPGSATHSVRGSVPGSTTHSRKPSAGSRPSVPPSTTHSVSGRESLTASAKATARRRTLTSAATRVNVITTLTRSARQARANREAAEAAAAAQRPQSRLPSAAASRQSSRQSSVANTPAKQSKSSISSSDSTTSARSVISNHNINKQKSPGLTKRISSDNLKNAASKITTLDRMKSNLNRLTSIEQEQESKTVNKLPMDASALTSEPSEQVKQSRTVVVDEIKPIKITVKEKDDVEVQSGNVSMPRSATNGITQRPG